MIQFFGGKSISCIRHMAHLPSSILTNPYQGFSTYTKPVQNGRRVYHHLDINTLSDKWFVDFSYAGSQLSEEEGKVRPPPFGKVFYVTLVQNVMRFVKGRPQYNIQLLANDLSRLAFWNPAYGKFQIVRSSQYKQEVVTIQKIIKSQPSSKPHQFVASFEQQQFPLTLYRFHFYNNKIAEQKSKEFFMTEADFMLFQLTIKNGHQSIVGHEFREQYDIWNLQKQIIDKSMIINTQYENEQQ